VGVAGRRRQGEEEPRGWDAVERAEERLGERSEARERRRLRRDRRGRVRRWSVRLLLPFAGAAVLLALLEREGGDFGGWSRAATIAVVAAAFVLPAAIAAWLSRRDGWLVAAAWVIGVIAVQAALVLWVGFIALGYGPA
jgi:fatty acid desaturase